MHFRSWGLGLIALGVLLLGAQLILSMGPKTARDVTTETHPAPQVRRTVLPGVFGAIALAAGMFSRTRHGNDAPDH
jgi:hypothetical protein